MSHGLDDYAPAYNEKFVVTYDVGNISFHETALDAKRAAHSYNNVYGPQQARAYERIAYKFQELSLDD